MAFDFGQDRRLRKHAEFVRAQRLGRRVGTPHFTLLVSAQTQTRGLGAPDAASARGGVVRASRLGLVVARKIGGAVRRNRVKRLCRECFRLWPELIPSGVDMVVIARKGADELVLAEVQAEWRAVEPLLKNRAAEALAQAARSDHPGPAARKP